MGYDSTIVAILIIEALCMYSAYCLHYSLWIVAQHVICIKSACIVLQVETGKVEAFFSQAGWCFFMRVGFKV